MQCELTAKERNLILDDQFVNLKSFHIIPPICRTELLADCPLDHFSGMRDAEVTMRQALIKKLK